PPGLRRPLLQFVFLPVPRAAFLPRCPLFALVGFHLARPAAFPHRAGLILFRLRFAFRPRYVSDEDALAFAATQLLAALLLRYGVGGTAVRTANSERHGHPNSQPTARGTPRRELMACQSSWGTWRRHAGGTGNMSQWGDCTPSPTIGPVAAG